MTAPTLLQWFAAYRDAFRDEAEAYATRCTESRIDTREAHGTAVSRRLQLEARLDGAIRDAQRELTHCRRTHVEMTEPGVFAVTIERGGGITPYAEAEIIAARVAAATLAVPGLHEEVEAMRERIGGDAA